MPTTIPKMAIFTMGLENPTLGSDELRASRRAMKCGRPKRRSYNAALKLIQVMVGLVILAGTAPAQVVVVPPKEKKVLTGAERTAVYLPLLQGARVAVVSNQTGLIGGKHLVDSLLSHGVQIAKVFAPEHGFRGEAANGESVKDEKDMRTGLPIISLYGKNKKPSAEQLQDVDLILFDIQDVGVRFYTFISTLHYIMEAAAELDRKVIVLDRPNPNGFYVDGPVLDLEHSSFVGMHPVPLVHGMTIGEYAGMINGEGWLRNGSKCDLKVIACEGYDHSMYYELPVPPSPNLPNMSSIYLYPSLGLFEGTILSVGRGTDRPFQCIGYPGSPIGNYKFTPQSRPGAKDPPHEGLDCTGLDLSDYGEFQSRLDRSIKLHWLIGMYRESPDKSKFFNNFFDKLAGGSDLRQRIIAGEDEDTIRATWKPQLMEFMKTRQKYLLYDDMVR